MNKTDSLQVRVDGAHTTVSLFPHTFGCIDSANRTVQQVCDLIQDVPISESANGTSRLHLDFSQIERISSAGLNGLVRLRSRTRSLGFEMVLVNLPPSVREVFELTRLERVFNLDEEPMTVI